MVRWPEPLIYLYANQAGLCKAVNPELSSSSSPFLLPPFLLPRVEDRGWEGDRGEKKTYILSVMAHMHQSCPKCLGIHKEGRDWS